MPFPAVRRWWVHLPEPTPKDLTELAELSVRVGQLWDDQVPERDDRAVRAALTEAGFHPCDDVSHVRQRLADLIDCFAA
ncbi:MAG: hypothetical protein NVV66_16420 [Cellulomonas sp.]|uniref:hypothetical protein n=1 Tax=Cellulomonas sp. TaxID=40001 RepID=UPI0025838046|nr:hypothetical protein [Cellulomonas sp.]MCR6706200.1 hypothetical protein [Cellulomonas sp.]